MKKTILSILLTVCIAFGSLAIFAGCDLFEKPIPETAPEYVEWLISNLKTNYNVSAGMQYTSNDSSMKDSPEFE